MEIVLCILKTAGVWLVLWVLGMNLIGFTMRGFYRTPPAMDSLIGLSTDRADEIIRREYRRMILGNFVVTLFFVVLTVTYYVALWHFWNIALAGAGAVIMAARIPDLLWEIRTGEKASRTNGPRGPIAIVATIALYAALPMVWYSLYKW